MVTRKTDKVTRNSEIITIKNILKTKIKIKDILNKVTRRNKTFNTVLKIN